MYIRLSKQIIPAEIVKQNIYTVWVRIADGTIIKRKIKRDIIKNYAPTIITKSISFWKRLMGWIKSIFIKEVN